MSNVQYRISNAEGGMSNFQFKKGETGNTAKTLASSSFNH
jgi:hypothetical protein